MVLSSLSTIIKLWIDERVSGKIIKLNILPFLMYLFGKLRRIKKLQISENKMREIKVTELPKKNLFARIMR